MPEWLLDQKQRNKNNARLMPFSQLSQCTEFWMCSLSGSFLLIFGRDIPMPNDLWTNCAILHGTTYYMIFVTTVSVKITLKVVEAAKMQFIFVISSKSVFQSAEKLWLIEASSQTDQYWQLELLGVVIKAFPGVADS